MRGRGEGAGSQPISTAVHMEPAKINSGNLTPYMVKIIYNVILCALLNQELPELKLKKSKVSEIYDQECR
jgi:hypothetical protein